MAKSIAYQDEFSQFNKEELSQLKRLCREIRRFERLDGISKTMKGATVDDFKEFYQKMSAPSNKVEEAFDKAMKKTDAFIDQFNRAQIESQGVNTSGIDVFTENLKGRAESFFQKVINKTSDFFEKRAESKREKYEENKAAWKKITNEDAPYVRDANGYPIPVYPFQISLYLSDLKSFEKAAAKEATAEVVDITAPKTTDLPVKEEETLTTQPDQSTRTVSEEPEFEGPSLDDLIKEARISADEYNRNLPAYENDSIGFDGQDYACI